MRRGVQFTAFLVPLLMGACRVASSEPSNQLSVKLQGESIDLFVLRPEGCAPQALLIVFHGSLRNASSARNAAKGIAQRHCWVVYAPELDKDRFPIWKYQLGGIAHDGVVQPRSEWTVNLAPDLVAWARKREGDARLPYFLFGHSAGGQYLSRVAAYATPSDARRIVIANPSSYVLPRMDVAAPYGFKGAVSSEDSDQIIKAYLALPITIFLGQEDTGDKRLTKSEAARSQGENRLLRGIQTYNSARRLASARSWTFNWKLVVVPAVGHDTSDMLDSPKSADAFDPDR
jgi:dienelactone hydrolase